MTMKAVILAGGLGSRLRPFTQIIPKPLLPVGESSVLEIQILGLKKCGFDHIYIATNYMADYVETFLGHGEKYGVQIIFSREEKPLGTCGPVFLLKDQLQEPFFLINGDILTTLDYSEAYKFAMDIDTNLVVLTKEMVTPFNFGRVISEDKYIIEIEEKPDFKMEILAGIYILKPPVFDLIPPNTYYGIDMLIKDMLARKMKIACYLMKDYWLDIGQITEYQVAQDAYRQHFIHLKDSP